MDPFTHGLAGVAATQSFAGKKKIRMVSFVGFVSAMLADLDFFIHHPQDPLLNVEIHRQFTHSLIFIPAGALLAALLLWLFVRRHMSFRELYLFSLISYATSGLLDSATSYGTMLLWPFSDTRFAWNVISVVDPVFTFMLFLIVGLTFYHRQKPIAWLAWIWIFSYLMLGFMQRERAAEAVEQLAENRGHRIERKVVKPTIGNLVLWRGVYEYDDHFHAAGIRLGAFSGKKIYEGESARRIYPAETYDDYMASLMYYDIMRFSRLSGGYLVHHPDEPGILGDARYSMLPTSLTPLWGIHADTTQPEESVTLHYFRDAGAEVRESFMDMLLGRDLE